MRTRSTRRLRSKSAPARSAAFSATISAALLALALTACTSSGGSSPGTASGTATPETTAAAPTAPSATEPVTTAASSQVSEAAGSNGAVGTAVPGASAAAVQVAFDTPGADPRPLKETTVDITGTPSVLAMDITGISYRGLVCGFTFRGTQRPSSPVTIRMTGTAGGLAFDSGQVKVAWTGDQVTADAAADEKGGWNFLSDATPSRNGQGWVVQLGAIPKSTDSKELPSSAGCTLTSPTALGAANGPVGYWAGFATR